MHYTTLLIHKHIHKHFPAAENYISVPFRLDTVTFFLVPEMDLSQRRLPGFGNRGRQVHRETETLKIITLQNTTLQQPNANPLAGNTL